MSIPTKNLMTAVVAGTGAGGTGSAVARLFASKGYRVALLSRYADEQTKLVAQIQAEGGVASAFTLKAYDFASIKNAFEEIEKLWPSDKELGNGVRFGCYNAGSGPWNKFLEITEEQLVDSLGTNVIGSFAFSQELVKAIMNSTTDEDALKGHRGTLVITGATAATRGGEGMAAFAAAKCGTRAISQSIAREYGRQGIHSAFAIIDGGINTPRSAARMTSDEAKAKYADNRRVLSVDSIAQAYWYLHQQDPSCWTQELDLRPAHEKF